MPPRDKKTLLLRMLLVCLASGILSLAAAVPFVWESQSLYYKLGHDRALLQWGKAAGMAALAFILFQMVLMSRFKTLDRLIGIRSLFSLHRYLGLAVALLILLHPLLVLWADGFSFFPVALRYWPEFLGGLTLVWGLSLAGTALFREHIGLSHATWQTLHRVMVPVFFILAFVHAGFVSETFNHHLPRYGLIVAGSAGSLLWLRRYLARRKSITDRRSP